MENNHMEIRKDSFVVIEYTVRLEDGSYVKGEDGPVSLNFIVGYEQVLPALERRLLGLEEGSEIEFVIPAGEAFGQHQESLLRTSKLTEFPKGRDLQVGKWVVATNEDTQAQYSYFVKEKTEDAVVLDFNHPLAGKDLYYRVKLVRVRPALQEELEYLRPCEHSPEAGDSAPYASS
jgi:FKBP-type peptidyl-prolyl cis-trans isomerase SlyD